MTGWISNSTTDWDGDGCADSLEDEDNDNDLILDQFDDCINGELNWQSNQTSDYDGDGCKDTSEDLDDDSDSIIDTLDDCQFSYGNSTIDRNGCLDFDGDGYSNVDSEWLWANGADRYPMDSSQWSDFDGDGFGDNLDGTEGDSCPSVAGNSTSDRYGCPDSDGDSLSDLNDDFPNDPLRGSDNDDDGYDDALDDACPQVWGNSSSDRYGCLDTDGDTWSDPSVDWSTMDGADAFPIDSTQWEDDDLDFYGSNPIGTTPDSCPTVWGNSSIDRYGCVDQDGDQVSDLGDSCPLVMGNSTRDVLGCPDSDGDGLSDQNDAFPEDPLRGGDQDNDGFDDAIEDDCPLQTGNSTSDRIGCQDSDGDTWSDGDENWSVLDGADAFPLEISQWHDMDGDGFGDLIEGFQGDACPLQYGESTNDRFGCIDTDNDGYSNAELSWSITNGADALPNESSQWLDADGDGFGDNLLGSQPDACPMVAGYSNQDVYGCLDTDSDGVSDTNDDFPEDATRRYDDDGDGFANIEDDCISKPGNSFFDRFGCPDIDGDGWSNIDVNWTSENGADVFPTDSSQWNDFDNDGYGDSLVGNDPDICPFSPNNSIVDEFGCALSQLDSDGDGLNNAEDPCHDSTINLCFNAAFGVGGATMQISAFMAWFSAIIIGILIIVQGRKRIDFNTILNSYINKANPSATKLPERNTKVIDGLTGYENETPTSFLDPSRSAEITGFDSIRFEKGPLLTDEGGMKMIFNAIDTERNIPLVWKEASDHKGIPIETCNARLIAEAELLSKIEHERIPKMFAAGQIIDSNGRTVEVMIEEFIQGPTLSEVLQRNEKIDAVIPIGKVLEWINSLCDPLTHILTSEGIWHRDLKPANIIVGDVLGPVLIDFGIAKEQEIDYTRQTSAIFMSGTWSPPERSDGVSGGFTDVYSLGKIMYALIVSKPFAKAHIGPEDRNEIIKRTGKKYEWIADLIIQACDANHHNRIPSVIEFQEYLREHESK